MLRCTHFLTPVRKSYVLPALTTFCLVAEYMPGRVQVGMISNYNEKNRIIYKIHIGFCRL